MFKKSITFLLFLSLNLSAQIISYDFEEENLSDWKSNANWAIDEDKSSMVLSLLHENNQSAFNICYNPDINFTEGNISVLFRANRGKIDQGGGLMWRLQDPNNYYVARFNPLENNFRFYIVEKGIRYEIASTDIKLTGGWHSMRISQTEDMILGYLDDKQVLTAKGDRLKSGGAVGVWTKADALSSFDDLLIETK